MRALQLDTKFKNAERLRPYEEAWAFYRNTFSGTDEEMKNRLLGSLEDTINLITTNDLNSCVRLLKHLGYSKEALDLIDKYVACFKSNSKRFDLSAYPFRTSIDDEDIIRIFGETYKDANPPMSLKEAVAKLVQESTALSEVTDVMKIASIEDYVDLFEQEWGDDLTTIVGGCIGLRRYTGEPFKSIVDKVESALKKIASKSKLNQVRIQQYGVSPE